MAACIFFHLLFENQCNDLVTRYHRSMASSVSGTLFASTAIFRAVFRSFYFRILFGFQSEFRLSRSRGGNFLEFMIIRRWFMPTMCNVHLARKRCATCEIGKSTRTEQRVKSIFILSLIVCFLVSAGLILWQCLCVHSAPSYYFIYRHKCKFNQIKRQNVCVQSGMHRRAVKHSWLNEFRTSAGIWWARDTVVCAQQSRRNYTLEETLKDSHISVHSPQSCAAMFLQKEIKMPKSPLDGSSVISTRPMAFRLLHFPGFYKSLEEYHDPLKPGSFFAILLFSHINSTFGMFLCSKNLVLQISNRSEFAIKLVHVCLCVFGTALKTGTETLPNGYFKLHATSRLLSEEVL